MYPLISEYIKAIKVAEDNLDELRNLRPVLDEDGEPVMSSGNFAVVFKMKDEKTGKLHAVKCFLREEEGRADAYRMISEELEHVNSTFLTPIKYLDKELFVDSNNSNETEFPVLLMDWVEGQTLDKCIQKYVNRYLRADCLDDLYESQEKDVELLVNIYELENIAYQFSSLAIWLLQQPFAHGDLKPDNIIVKEDGTLVLVDYDGMYVPAMKGQKARELGSPDFRHPLRNENDFDEHIDDFPLSSILLSLLSIANNPSLWEKYGGDGRLLLSERDYRNIAESEVLDALRPLMADKNLTTYLSLFYLCSAQKSLFKESYPLFTLKEPEKPYFMVEVENLSTEVTEEDLEKAWIDEFGAKYSADRKRLLLIPDDLIDYRIRRGTLVICDDAMGRPNMYGKLDNKLESLFLPDTIRIITSWPLIGSLHLKKIVVDTLNPVYDSRYNCNAIIESKNNNLLLGCQTTIIPNDITSISYGAFGSCVHLKSIIIPDSVISIGESAFMNCEQLSEIYIPASVTHIGNRAFNGCDIKSVIVDKSNSVFDSRENCNAIISTQEDKIVFGCKNTIIPTSTLIIGDNAFECCELDELEIPYNITTIETGAFSYCENLEKISFPSSLTEIGVRAFLGCKKLTTIIFHNSIEKIGFGAFQKCDAIEQVIIPKGTIKNFEALQLGNSLVSSFIEKDINEDICTERSSFWYNCWEDEYGGEYSSNGRFLIGFGSYDYDLTIYKIKEGTRVICDLAFNNYENDNHFLKGVYIPSSVIAIGKGVFAGCTDDFEIICDSPFFEVDAGLLYNKTHTRLIACLDSSKQNIVIDPRVDTIGAYCFSFCEIETIFLSKLVEIEEHAIDSVDSIIIPSGMKTEFEKKLPKYKDNLVEQEENCGNELKTHFNIDQKYFLYMLIRRYANELILCFEDEQKEDLDKKLLYIELTILLAGSVLDFKNENFNNWFVFAGQKILNDYLSLKEVDDYDKWIEIHTPGMCSDGLYTIEEAISLAEFEEENGQVKFFKGNINAYPYDDSFWGEFVDNNGMKQIIYVNQGFPLAYNVSELSKNKTGFGIIEEKETYYHGDEIVFCLKEIKKKHSMLPSYINKRLSFYRDVIEEAHNQEQLKAYSFQLYNALTNEMLNYNDPGLGIDDLVIDDDTIINNATGEFYQFNAISMNKFSTCIWEKLNKMSQELNKKVL